MKLLRKLFVKQYMLYLLILLVSSIITVISALFLDIEKEFPNIEIAQAEKLATFFAIRMGSLFFLVGTIFVFIATKYVLQPIVELSECSKEVSKGNFNIKAKSFKTRNDELSDLVDNFNVMVDQLSKNEYLHKDFVSNLSHEYKTPLTAIQGYAEMLSTCELSKEQVIEYADNIIKQSVRLNNLSNELLRLSEIENKTIKKISYQLDVQIRDIIILFQKQWEDKNIELDINLDEVTFIGDKELMFHALSNLISNAIKYSNKFSEIKISLLSNEKITFIIEDNGIGIEQSKVDKIFDRFYQTDESHSTIGNGLGLSIVHKVINLHEGTIEVESELNKGSKFKVVI